ncbi:MAG: tRNA pseudouridine(55) synthase TruB [Lachnospiraceae bacterium]|nr:tRNA pseudouridine(55) synthase TruB [Lachnospiraceae bacterium]
MINGIINIYKEKGYTSHDVVARLRGIFKQKKIGHTGTLDPEAEGVLPVCLGCATKLCDLLTDKDKEYVAVMRLGIATDTQDMTGEAVKRGEVLCSEDEIRETIASFTGEIMQMPPMYSALKVNGKKLYELAREGKTVERAKRPVTINEIEILKIDLPLVKMRVSCSKGTYIRTLCNDIGEKLGCFGCMEELLRTRVSVFELKDALKLDEVEHLVKENKAEPYVLKIEDYFKDLKPIRTYEKYDVLIDNGNRVKPSQLTENVVYPENEWVRAYRHDNTFMGIYAYNKDNAAYNPVKMFKPE